MNIMNDLNILPDPPETWQAKISRLVRDVFLPYAVPYVIPAFLSWKVSRGLHVDPNDKISSLQAEIRRLKFEIENFHGHITDTQQKEYQKHIQMNRDLDAISNMLEERQDIYCSPFKHKETRLKLEKKLREYAVERPYERELKLFSGIEEILEKDCHCGTDRSENGCLMWVYMELWRTRARLNMQENVILKMRAYDLKGKKSKLME
nr:coiled-coil domain-containing protein 127-like [Lytechinus pictus]